MKKFLIILISVNIFSLPALSVVTDTLVDQTLDSTLVIKKQAGKKEVDSLVEQYLDKNLSIKVHKTDFINDDLANKLPVKKISTSGKVVNITDDFLPKISNLETKKYLPDNRIISEESIKIAVRINKELSTKTMPEEGESVEFETVSDVKINNKMYPKGTKVVGRIETVSMNTSMGVPADLVLGSFNMQGLSLAGEIKKIGANRSLWVYPSAYVGSMFFGVGILLMAIRGGHAKLTTNEVFTLDY